MNYIFLISSASSFIEASMHAYALTYSFKPGLNPRTSKKLPDVQYVDHIYPPLSLSLSLSPSPPPPLPPETKQIT